MKSKASVSGFIDKKNKVIGLVIKPKVPKKFISLVTGLIPEDRYQFNGNNWFIALEYEEQLWEILADCFETIILDETDIGEEDWEENETTSEKVEININSDELFSILNKDDIKAIYRLLAMRYHPDRENGNTDKMKAINSFFEQFK